MLQDSTYPNLLNAYPFQIDGNFGILAGICEMLLQSHRSYIEVLPALPDEWTDGEICGIRARGGYTVGIKWRNGKAKKIEIIPDYDSICKIKGCFKADFEYTIENEIMSFKAAKGKKYVLTSEGV